MELGLHKCHGLLYHPANEKRDKGLLQLLIVESLSGTERNSQLCPQLICPSQYPTILFLFPRGNQDAGLGNTCKRPSGPGWAKLELLPRFPRADWTRTLDNQKLEQCFSKIMCTEPLPSPQMMSFPWPWGYLTL